MATLVKPSPSADTTKARSGGPIGWFTGWVRRTYEKEIDGTGLALFRIIFSLVQLCEVIQVFYFRHLIYDHIPYLEPYEIDFTIPLVTWMVALFCLALGFMTRWAALVNVVFTLTLFGSMEWYEYHMIYAYQGMSFLFLLMPVSQVLSVDRLLTKLKYSNTRFQYNPPRTVPQLAYFTPLLLAVAFVYFGSIFYKLASPLWRGGMGLWKPASLAFITHVNNSWLLNVKWLALGLGYLTFAFELVYLFTFTRKAWRVPLMIIGVGLHVGILWEFPIPWFAAGFTGIYLLMVPVSWWQRLFHRTERAPKLTVYYDAECPLCVRARIAVEHFDTRGVVRFRSVQAWAAEEPALRGVSPEALLANIHAVDAAGRVHRGFDTYLRVLSAIWYLKPLSWLLRVPGFYHLGRAVYANVAENRTTERCTDDTCGYVPPVEPKRDEEVKLMQNLTLRDVKVAGATALLGLACLVQTFITYDSLLIRRFREAYNIDQTRAGQAVLQAVYLVQSGAATVFGITNHGVFMDHHFDRYNHIVAVTYTHPDGREEFLPMIDENGQPEHYVWGMQWVNWSFRVVGHDVVQANLYRGIRDYSAFWAKKHGVDLTNARFNVKVKKIEIPYEWAPDVLNKHIAAPWIDAGYAEWRNQEFEPHIREIEKM